MSYSYSNSRRLCTVRIKDGARNYKREVVDLVVGLVDLGQQPTWSYVSDKKLTSFSFQAETEDKAKRVLKGIEAFIQEEANWNEKGTDEERENQAQLKEISEAMTQTP